jgi:hypothetical protein
MPTTRTITLALVLMVALVGAFMVGRAAARAPRPIPAPAALVKARAECPVDQPLACRAALVHALRAVAWQKHARIRNLSNTQRFGTAHALRLAAALYGVPVEQLRRVADCESHLNPSAKNRISTATGLFQFLASTWRRAGIRGFTRTDPYANAIAAARLVRRDGSWREWSCGFRA